MAGLPAISTATQARILVSLTDRAAGQEVINALNAANASTVQDLFVTPLLIVGTNVSTTIDFGGLVVGDKILILPAAAGNAQFVTCAVAGTLPQAGVVGSLYVVFRAYSLPAASTQGF
jgi:hypothetical protein